ncbi:MAG: hypothetical protein WB424_01175 [Terracidiphilus sp.]|jgi:hypothetical protein
MRRGLAIFLILFFGFGPVASALAATDESRLPPCCRRHGAHHCAMMARWRAQMDSGKPSVGAPSTCPLYPGFGPPSIASLDALIAAPAQPTFSAQTHLFIAHWDSIQCSPVRTRAGRGPPASNIG